MCDSLHSSATIREIKEFHVFTAREQPMQLKVSRIVMLVQELDTKVLI